MKIKDKSEGIRLKGQGKILYLSDLIQKEKESKDEVTPLTARSQGDTVDATPSGFLANIREDQSRRVLGFDQEEFKSHDGDSE